MKTLQRQRGNKLPTAEFIERDLSLLFAEGYVPFTEKITSAKVALKNVKLPSR